MMPVSTFSSSRWQRTFLSLALLVSLSIAAGCGGDGTPPAAAAGAPGGGGPMAVPVEMTTLALKPVEQSTEFVGTVKSLRRTTIQPQAEGFLKAILVKSGDRVKEGTPLFEIDSNVQQAAVASLEGFRAAREADLTFARQQADRAKRLLEAGAMSQAEVDQAQAGLKAAEAQLKAIDEQIRQQKVELAFYRVIAPTPGIVGDVPVRPGDRVTRQTPLTTLEDNTGLEVYVQIPVHETSRLKLGLPVRLLSDTGMTLATEKITFISSSVDDATQTVLVKTALEGRGAQFRTDQFVRAQIVFGNQPALTVPVVALNRINGVYFAFVAEPGAGGTFTARQRSITVGPVVGNHYLVTGGLKPGDQVIVSGIQKIGDGVPVMTMPAGPPPGAPGGKGDPAPAGKGGPAPTGKDKGK
jgi:RND family efflux transporter MFP subunit